MIEGGRMAATDGAEGDTGAGMEAAPMCEERALRS